MSFQFGNRFSQSKTVDATSSAYISGSTKTVSQEFRDIVGGTFKANDLDALVREVLLGDGVDGVSIGRITADALTIEFHNAGQVDTLFVENAGDLIADLSGRFQFGNRFSQFKVVDAEANEYISGSTRAVSGELNDIVGGTFKSGEIDKVLAELVEGDGIDGVSITSLTGDSVTLEFANAGQVDTLVVTNIADVLADLSSDGFQFGNPKSQLKVVDAGTNAYISGSTNKVSEELNDIVGGTFKGGDVDALLAELVHGDGVDQVELVDFDDAADSATIEFRSGGAVDTLVVTNTDFDFG